MSSENKNPKVEIKQGAITAKEITAAKRIRALGFRGSYKGVKFDDDGLSESAVNPEIIASLKEQFPGLQIEDVA
ncbi:MAG TPA: hypothetical protein VFC63_09820 [Blastocatellia bacterium]|nr:hypothetical protein [Blastocatellia bacterium]